MKHRILAAAVAIHAVACLCAFVAASRGSVPETCREERGSEAAASIVTKHRPAVQCESPAGTSEAVAL